MEEKLRSLSARLNEIERRKHEFHRLFMEVEFNGDELAAAQNSRSAEYSITEEDVLVQHMLW